MIHIPPYILLDPHINKSLSDILEHFGRDSFISILRTYHSADFLHFTVLVKDKSEKYKLIESRASAVIQYDSSKGMISLIYLGRLDCREAVEIDLELSSHKGHTVYNQRNK